FAFYLPDFTSLSKPLLIGALLGYYIITVDKQNRKYIFFLILEMVAQVFFSFGSKSSMAQDLSTTATLISSFFLIFLTFPVHRGLLSGIQKISFAFLLVFMMGNLA